MLRLPRVMGAARPICSNVPHKILRRRPSPKQLCDEAVPSTTRLLRSDNSDTAELALLNEFNKANVGFVKGIVPHRGAGLSRLLTQPLIHRQPFPENRTQFVGQIKCRQLFEADAIAYKAIDRNRAKRLTRQSVPR